MTLHIANTFFEEELAQDTNISLLTRMEASPIFLQLQYLPFLYGDARDAVWVSAPPPPSFFENLRKAGIEPPRYASDGVIESWGASKSIAAFAKEKGLQYRMPPWDVVRLVNSKEFSFRHSPQLKGSSLIHNEEELSLWLAKTSGPRVLKSCFGVSGRGHFFLHKGKDPLAFAHKEWRLGSPLVAEPWVERVLDFSTQWEISEEKEVKYLGATLCENNPQGRYQSSSAGGVFGAFLEEHKQIALPLIYEIAALGYFGNIGIDAMLYKDGNEKSVLHPVVEINARKTMGWVALKLQRRLGLESITLRFLSKHEVEQGFLPEEIRLSSGRQVVFEKQLHIVLNSTLR